LFVADPFKAAFNRSYLIYRHLSENLYAALTQYPAATQLRSVFIKADGLRAKGLPNRSDAVRK
jgi:hypothetical protein